MMKNLNLAYFAFMLRNYQFVINQPRQFPILAFQCEISVCQLFLCEYLLLLSVTLYNTSYMYICLSVTVTLAGIRNFLYGVSVLYDS